jgi:Nif-specific regulatory protein
LRERREDVDKLAIEFLRRFNKEHGVSLTLSKRAMDVLRACDFPGNVRELESCVKRTAALAKGSVIVVEDFSCSNDSCLSVVLGKSMSESGQQNSAHGPLPIVSPVAERSWPVRRTHEPASAAAEARAEDRSDGGRGPGEGENPDERQRLIDAMERSGWVQAKAARFLRLTPRQMGYALRKHNVEIKRF